VPYVLFRAIKGKGARVSDFWSAFALGEEPFPNQLKEPLEWIGVSTFSDLGVAAQVAVLWRQGRYLAELHIPDDANAIVRQTGRKNPTHHSVAATPQTLLSFVVQVVPIIDQAP
jgi:hypothetical protein